MLAISRPLQRGDAKDRSEIPVIGAERITGCDPQDNAAQVARVFLSALQQNLQPIASHPDLRCVSECAQLRCQSFFWEQDDGSRLVHTSALSKLPSELQRRTKPVFFSPSARSIVISAPLLRDLVAARYANGTDPEGYSPVELSDYVKNRFEFALHEYGHLASFHKAIVPISGMKDVLQDQRRDVTAMLARVPAHLRREDGVALLPEILSDLRAEVLRNSISFPDEANRDPGVFIRDGLEERVSRNGAIRSRGCNLYGLLRIASWFGICRSGSDTSGAAYVLDEIRETCRAAHTPSLIGPVSAAAEFFGVYATSHQFDAEAFRISVGTDNPAAGRI